MVKIDIVDDCINNGMYGNRATAHKKPKKTCTCSIPPLRKIDMCSDG